MRSFCWPAVAMLAATAGCQGMAVADDVPARISPATDASRMALQAAVDDATGMHVELGADALVTSSVLTIERKVPRSVDGQDAYGRNTEMPRRFRLVRNGTDCILVDERDSSRRVLENTACVAE